MYLEINQNMLLLTEGNTLVTSVPCQTKHDIAIATVMLMCTLRANAVKQLTIIGSCIWPVTKREDLQEILLPYYN